MLVSEIVVSAKVTEISPDDGVSAVSQRLKWRSPAVQMSGTRTNR